MIRKMFSVTKDSKSWHITMAEEHFHYKEDNVIIDYVVISREYDVQLGYLEPHIVELGIDNICDHETLTMLIETFPKHKEK